LVFTDLLRPFYNTFTCNSLDKTGINVEHHAEVFPQLRWNGLRKFFRSYTGIYALLGSFSAVTLEWPAKFFRSYTGIFRGYAGIHAKSPRRGWNFSGVTLECQFIPELYWNSQTNSLL
jgi:hypothetical protein